MLGIHILLSSSELQLGPDMLIRDLTFLSLAITLIIGPLIIDISLNPYKF